MKSLAFNQIKNDSRNHFLSHRSGLATIWIILSVPLSIATLQLVLEVGWMHRTRSELQVAINGGALAGARVWGVSSPNTASDNAVFRTSAKQAAYDVLSYHTVAGTTVLNGVSLNNDPNATNNNLVCPGSILLGDFSAGAFSSSMIPVSSDRRGCRCSVSIQLSSPFGLGVRTFSATATARWNSGSSKAILVTVSSFSCI